jgi:hypothetical protein
MKSVYSLICGLLAITTLPAIAQDYGAASVLALPVEIAPDNPNLHYMGRFDMTNAAGPTCAWSASAIAIRFHGTAINAQLTLGANRFEVIVDGAPTKILTGSAIKTLYSLTSGLNDADHTVMLFKDTEAAVGTASFGGFQLNAGGTILPYPASQYRLEVIGDSISCGYGNEATDPHQHFTPATENAYLSYGAVAARAFNADYTCIAWSGKKLWPDNTIVSLYDLVLPPQSEPIWKFDAPKPQAVLINLCTNDFGRSNPEEEGWVKTYHSFIGQVRKNYPDATIYLALGSMMGDWSPDRHPLTDARGYIQRVVSECNSAGDNKIHFLEFAVQNPAVNGVGADWHPSAKTDQVMADTFVSALRKDPGWVPVTSKP